MIIDMYAKEAFARSQTLSVLREGTWPDDYKAMLNRMAEQHEKEIIHLADSIIERRRHK